MRTFFQKSAMTLMELIVASALMGIMMIGLVSVDLAVRNSRESSSADALVAMQTQAAMLRINNDAVKAVGNAPSPGVSTTSGALCVRQDTDNDPNTFIGDTWVCYWRDSVTYNIHRCTAASPQVCAGSDPQIGQAINFAYTFTLDSASKEIFIDFSITNRFKPTLAAHPVTNPDYTISTHVSPPGHGF